MSADQEMLGTFRRHLHSPPGPFSSAAGDANVLSFWLALIASSLPLGQSPGAVIWTGASEQLLSLSAKPGLKPDE
jgi:hypothetical protein